MKKLLMKPFVLPVILIVLYLFGLVLGAFAVSAYPICYTQKRHYTSQARAIAQEYLAGTEETLNSMRSPDTHILFYDIEGNCIQHVTLITGKTSAEPGVLLEQYIPSVLTGKEIFRLVPTQENRHKFKIVTGIPIMEDSSVIGAVFLIKNLMDLPEAIVGYCIYFTIFYWLSAYLIISNIHRKQKLDKLQQTYIANVTHAFKTPIASIKALAETLCDGVEPDPDRQKVYYGMILREANRQHHMIQDVLELSKLQSNGMDFTKTNVCAAGVFDPVLNKYATLCDCMGISLHISEEISRLPPLYTNPACVKQLLEILLDNALKFVHEGGDIWVETACTRNKATICVRDNGIGIAKEALPHVFERFYKCSHDFNESGSGLGLAIAEEIVSGLKEKIWAESEPGKGAAFFFTVHHR